MSQDFITGIPVRPYASTSTKYASPQPAKADSAKSGGVSFADTLTKAQSAASGSTLKFSAHALERIQQRGIQLQPADLKQLEQAVDSLAQKGTKNGYVLYGNSGFVVNIPNRTVVTTMSHDTPTVVTKIDSVAVVPRPDR